MNLFYQPNIENGIRILNAEESRHCVKVLRKRAGDTIQITDGKGRFYTAQIEHPDAEQCSFKIIEQQEPTPALHSIMLAISPTKNADRIEWLVEKATEFGVDDIFLMTCDHTERVYLKKDRLEKVAISAMKQSLKARLPRIHDVQKFDTVLQLTADQKFIAVVDHSNPKHLQQMALPSSTYLVLIGPEGDFSPAEVTKAVDNAFHKVSLGPSRLRTETAGLAACHILNLINC